MVTVPKLTCDKQVLTLDAALLEQLLKTFTYTLLIAIDCGCVNVLQK